MEVFYQSTRNKEEKVTASQAILKGLSDEGVCSGNSSGTYKKPERIVRNEL